ncbi:hypothetical protein [Halomonas elongata]|uniref:hypothetical protein n=1 Tax=Halomonas elongata TaxID=2746 RepID=UPI0040340279
MHKTGSSSIQNALYGYDDGEVEYLKLRRPNHSLELVSAIMPDIENYAQIKKRKLSSQQLAEYKRISERDFFDALDNASGKDVIISSEYFSQPGAQARNNLDKLKAVLDKYFDKIRVIAYVRAPKNFMESALQERVKGGDTQITMRSLYPFYRGRLEKFYELFGSDSVDLIDYDPSSFPNGSVVSDFSKRLGLTLGKKASVRSNEKLGFEALSFLYSYNSFRGFANPACRFVNYSSEFISGLRSLSDSPFSISPRVVEEIFDLNSEDVKWTEQATSQSYNTSGSSGYLVEKLSDLVEHARSNKEFYEKIRSVESFEENFPRNDLFENFLRSGSKEEGFSLRLSESSLNSLKNPRERPQAVFREISKSLYESGLLAQSKAVLDLSLKSFPGAKGLQEMNEVVSSAMDDLGWE